MTKLEITCASGNVETFEYDSPEQAAIDYALLMPVLRLGDPFRWFSADRRVSARLVTD